MSDWKERLVTEFKELNARRKKLEVFIGNDPLSVIDSDENNLLIIQLFNMRAYEEVLRVRIKKHNLIKENLMDLF